MGRVFITIGGLQGHGELSPENPKQCDKSRRRTGRVALINGTSASYRKERVIRMRGLGIVLIVVGIAIVIWGAFGFTTRKKVADIGPIHATKSEEHNVPYGTIAGAVIALGGVVLLVKSKG